MESIGGVCDVMYTTYENDHSDLEKFTSEWWE